MSEPFSADEMERADLELIKRIDEGSHANMTMLATNLQAQLTRTQEDLAEAVRLLGAESGYTLAYDWEYEKENIAWAQRRNAFLTHMEAK